MTGAERQYVAIDLKSFYASVECVERGLDPLDACLVVADRSRTEKTICLAVSPALKSFGIGGRPRLFEVVQRVREVNRTRGRSSRSIYRRMLDGDLGCAVDYIVAPPRMALYLDYSTRIYQVYLRYIAPEDIHIYSIDEVFMDVTDYLTTYRISAHDLAMKMIREVLAETGITATAGIGTNMYLCKIAMDIVAKKMKPDKDGVRIAELDEMSYRRQLWDHLPITDFWRVGRGTATKLARYGILTMGDVARASLTHESFLYKLFGVNAELLIDHAWGWEPVTMAQVKSYRPETHSISSGQVLNRPYPVAEARIVAMEMADSLALELLDKRYLTDRLVLEVGYDVESLSNPAIASGYHGRITTDHYGRNVPFHAHGTASLPEPTSSYTSISGHIESLFDRIVNPGLLVRRLTLTACDLLHEGDCRLREKPQQLDLFVDYEKQMLEKKSKAEALSKERRRQETILKIKRKFGKNAILRGLNFAIGATQRDRNRYIGGHHE